MVDRIAWEKFGRLLLEAVTAKLSAHGAATPEVDERLISLLGLPGLSLADALRLPPARCLDCGRLFASSGVSIQCPDCLAKKFT